MVVDGHRDGKASKDDGRRVVDGECEGRKTTREQGRRLQNCSTDVDGYRSARDGHRTGRDGHGTGRDGHERGCDGHRTTRDNHSTPFRFPIFSPFELANSLKTREFERFRRVHSRVHRFCFKTEFACELTRWA